MKHWRTVLQRLVAVLFLASALATVYLFIVSWAKIASYEGLAAIVFLGLLVLFGAVLLVWQEYRFSRKARYAESLPNLLAFARAMAVGESLTEDRCRAVMADAVREISEAFSLATGTRIGVCLKKVVLETTSNRCRVEDVCRDPKSKDRGERSRVRPDGRPVQHWVETNTAFKRTWTAVGFPAGAQYFLCNNLPGEPHYQNTSFEIYGEPHPQGTVARTFGWRDGWTLPYKSTLVVPVLGTAKVDGSTVVLGYLGLDSASINVFDTRYDVPLLRIFAEFLSPVLDQYMARQLEPQTR